MPKRYIRGDRAFKNLIKRLPETVKAEMIVELHVAGRAALTREKAAAPVKTGALSSALSMRVLPNTLKLKVGLIGKVVNKRLFYGHIIEFGRKASVKTVKRGNSKAYQLPIKAIAARHFVYTQSKEELYAPFRALWEKALAKASSGASDA